jgi:hypothetical protein
MIVFPLLKNRPTDGPFQAERFGEHRDRAFSTGGFAASVPHHVFGERFGVGKAIRLENAVRRAADRAEIFPSPFQAWRFLCGTAFFGTISPKNI